MNDTKLTSENPVSDFVNQNPDHAVGIFNNLDIDYCCGGGKTLKLACEEKALDPEEILRQLNNISAKPVENDDEGWALLGLSELVDHLVAVHHEYLKKAFPQLESLMEKVVGAHAKNHPELLQLQTALNTLRQDLEPHMLKEENILFPMIKNLEGSLDPVASHCGSVANPIRVMMADHDHAATLLEKIKTLRNNYSPPEDGCGSYRLLFEKLKELVMDTHLHVHKENNLLFPQVLKEAMPN